MTGPACAKGGGDCPHVPRRVPAHERPVCCPAYSEHERCGMPPLDVRLEVPRMKILSLFVRRDGAGHAYSLSPEDEAPERHFARNMFKTPGESFPGARAFEAWRRVDFWVVPPTCRTVRDAMAARGIDE